MLRSSIPVPGQPDHPRTPRIRRSPWPPRFTGFCTICRRTSHFLRRSALPLRLMSSRSAHPRVDLAVWAPTCGANGRSNAVGAITMGDLRSRLQRNLRARSIRRGPPCAEGPSKARPGGFEPPTCGLEVRCSIRLSYGRVWPDILASSPTPEASMPSSPAGWPRLVRTGRSRLSPNLLQCPATPRGVAQLGSAPRSGRGGRRFKSSHPDSRKALRNQGLIIWPNRTPRRIWGS
jgi:hypothetical protein